MSRLLQTALCMLVFSVLGKATSFNLPLETTLNSPPTDTIRPVIFCPGSIIINLAPMRCDTVVQYNVMAFDDQGQVIVIQLEGIASGGAFPSGATVNTFLATDLAGNTATCSFTVTTFEPMTQPLCRTQTTVFLGPNCTKSLKAFEILEGGPYGCAGHYITEVDKTSPFGDGPWATATFGAADVNMNYQVRVTSLLTNAKCWGNIVVKDNTPPVFNCQNIDVPCALPLAQLTPDFLRDSFGISTGVPIITDACSGTMLSIGFEDVLQNLPCNDTNTISGVINRIWTATDAYNNTSTCQQVIRRHRLLADVHIPGNKIVGCFNPDFSEETNGRPFIPFGNRQYALTPASFCEFDIQYFDTLQPGDCAGNYTLRRTWKIYDACLPFSAMNPKIAAQNIAVQDLIGPVIHCPADLIITVADNNCRGSVDLPDAFLGDNCSAIASFQAFWTDNNLTETKLGTIMIHAGVDTVGEMGMVASFPIGTTTMLYTAEDDCGNTGECSFNLTLANMTAPMAKCDSLLLAVLPNNGFLDVPAAALDNGSSDDCSPLVFKSRLTATNGCHTEAMWSDTLHFCCHNLGDTLAGILRVYDVAVPAGAVSNTYGAGHFTECNFNVTVSGSSVPFCTAPADISVTCADFDPTLQSYGDLLEQSCAVDSVSFMVNLSQFDTVCSRGTVTRIFNVFGEGNQTGQCSQKIVVDYDQDYYVRFPDDVIVTVCDMAGVYGVPTYFGKDCELLSATYTDQRFNVVPDACFKIERTWKIINWCTYDSTLVVTTVPNPSPNAVQNAPENLPGPIVSSIQSNGDPWKSTISKINPGDPLATNYSIYYSANANGYQYKQIIKVIDTQKPVVESCPSVVQMVQDVSTNDPQLWNASYWLDLLHLSSDLCEAPTEVSISATDNCSGSGITFKYQLSLDLNGDNVRETVVNSTSLPPVNTVYYNNASGGTGEARQFDFRPVPTAQKWRFALQEVVDGNKKTAYLRFNTAAAPNTYVTPQLPYGAHKIKWFVTDECGNETVCEYSFTVRDGKAPDVLCLSGLTVNILPSGTVPLQASDFLQFAQDNCTPNQLLVYGLRKAGSGTGFPADANGNPINSITYNCDELGTNPIELWARDRSGNANSCQSFVIINDNAGNCVVDPGLSVTGQISTEWNDPVKGVKVYVDAPSSPFFPAFYLDNFRFTDSLGNYDFGTQYNSIPVNSLFVKPVFNANPLNGVTTYDLVLISKHILGIEPITSPYKLIAADANKSGSITTFDIVEFRKLILGIYQQLPYTESWRFIDRYYVFPSATNPFQPPFPETILYESLDHDFIAIKVGDVNNTAVTDAATPPDERSAGTQYFHVATKEGETVQPGEIFEVSFRSEEALEGCQFTLNTHGLEVLNIQPGANMGQEHFGLFPGKNALTMAWEKGGTAEFTLKLKALEAGNLREMLAINSQITKAEAYQTNAEVQTERYDLALRFPELAVFELFQNRPNPFAGATDITFNLPESCEATLHIYDTNGRVLFTHSGNYDRGTHTISLEKSAIDAVGVLYYQLETPKYSAVKKMLKL